MRIRTVKPEFWTHPMWARQKDEVRLMAIAILNYADDDGYFFAEAELIREVQPFWSVEKIRRSIDELSKHDYLEVKKHDSYGLIGRVVNFRKHQRIDRAKASKIKDLWNSTNDRRMIDDESTLEQGNKGTREKEQGNKVEFKELIPPNLDTEEFIESWNKWLQHRKETKKKMTPTAAKEQLKKLGQWGLPRSIAAIAHSVSGGYQGIYEDKTKGGYPNQPPPQPAKPKEHFDWQDFQATMQGYEGYEQVPSDFRFGWANIPGSWIHEYKRRKAAK